MEKEDIIDDRKSRSWLQLFLIVLVILILVGCIISQEAKLNTYKRALEEWASPKEEKGLVINEPEVILFWYEGGDYFKNVPMFFLRITNTDMSKCFINDRLRLDLNGEIYWIRLEK